MNSQDVAIYREIQRNTETAIKVMESISDKVYDDDLALQIAKQSLKYSELHNEASKQLVEAKADSYHNSYFTEWMLKMGIGYQTLLNTSTAHIAEMMIKGSNKGVLEMEKIINHNSGAGELSTRLAQQFLDFEEKNIKRLKDYL